MSHAPGQLFGSVIVLPELGLHTAPEPFHRGEVAVVRGVLARLAPYHLDRVEFGTVLWEVVDPKPPAQGAERGSQTFGFVVGDVVEDEADLAVVLDDLDQERLEGAAVEALGAPPKDPWSGFHADGAEVLGRSLDWLMPDGETNAASRPAASCRAFLLERDFVFEDDDGSPLAGFF